MNRLTHVSKNRAQRKNRVRTVVRGTAERPRLSVNISLRHISAQLIDDSTHKTLAYVTTVGSKAAKGTMTERATWVGTEIAKQGKSAKVSTVVLDRGSKLYHGRVAALADAARKEGMEF
jgi:large subunit ribosomal protein L18